MSIIEQYKHIEFSKSIIEGVEIKKCRNTPHAYKSHIHNELSLGYIIEGSTNLSLNENTLSYKPGDGVIIPPLMTHRCEPNDINDWAYIMLYINTDYYDQALSFNQASKLTGQRAKKLLNFIELLLIEQVPDTLENILIDFLFEFSDRDVSMITTKSAQNTVMLIHDYILSNVTSDITLDILQQKFNINKFTLIRLFKKLYNTTPAAFHLQYRIAVAKKQLEVDIDVLDVCDNLGFFDQAHFTREFKRMYGVTPVAYTQQIKD